MKTRKLAGIGKLLVLGALLGAPACDPERPTEPMAPGATPLVRADVTLSPDVRIVVHDLGTLGGDFSVARAINEAGQVVGTSTTSSGEEHVFLWTSQGGMTDLGTLGGADVRVPEISEINDAGVIVGTMIVGSGSHGFRWSPGSGLRDLGVLDANRDFSSARDVNAQGTVSGESSGKPVIWSSGGFATVLGELQAGLGGGAQAINSAGHVAGDAFITIPPGLTDVRAFFWTSDGGMRNLGTLDNGPFSHSEANDINDHDQVIGRSDHRGFIWSPQGGMTDFQTLTGTDLVPLAINNHGSIVGDRFGGNTADGIPVSRAFLWTEESGLIGLDPIGFGLPCGECIPTAEAADINDNGMIVGSSTTQDGNRHATLWTLETVEENRPPLAVVGGPFAGVEGSPVGFDGSGSADPDGDALSYSWDFGDGSNSTDVSPSHAYVDNGAFQLTLTVTDSRGLSSAVVTSATIANVAPSLAPFAGATILRGETYTSAAAFTDPGADIWTAAVDYGDGSGPQPLSLVEKTFALIHSYDAPGTYQVSVMVSDDDGGSDVEQVSVVVQSPQQAIGALLILLDDLVASGVLSPGNANALGAKLRAALTKLDAGNPAVAANQLRAFVNQVNSLVGEGSLPPEQGRALVDTAMRIIRAIQLF